MAFTAWNTPQGEAVEKARLEAQGLPIERDDTPMRDVDDPPSDGDPPTPTPPPATLSLPADLQAFRMPTTMDQFAPQYISVKAWTEALTKAQSADAAVRRSGRQTLNRYNYAGRVQETDEGLPAFTECRLCKRAGYVCRAYKDIVTHKTTCGYCFSRGKADCGAGKPVDEGAEPAVEDAAGRGIIADMEVKMAAMEDDIELLTDANLELENKGKALLSEIELLKGSHSAKIKGLVSKIKLLKDQQVDLLASYELNQEELTTVREALEEKDAAIERRLAKLEGK
ncbi:unnamed protein product [Zymoseptoria tritici ST99CH_1A5]|uniref:Uncharacterized protein n=1 Tax=Zymoseptoria tritici ST99CH_1A5 TaxID=1276529 RepID=A0A1Y6LAX4_ZYMTR|nr:unnamed protein product [Zymoseptoria tritici ST99CH_1A5]